MKNKLIILALATMIALTGVLSGCGETEVVAVNVENNSTLNGATIGKSALKKIVNYLYYDANTKIVYWWNGCLSGDDSSATPTPYYSSNGLLYRYNPETNTLEEVNPYEKTTFN